MTYHYPRPTDSRSTDAALSERMAATLQPGTTVLAHARWYRVLAAHVALDGGLDLDVEPRDPINARMLDLGAAFGVILRLHEPSELQWRTYTIARSSQMAQEWAHTQGDTGWSEWRGSNGYEPWHYLPQPHVQLRGLDPRRMRVVLVDMEDHEVDEATRSQLAVLASMGARIETHRDLWRSAVRHARDSDVPILQPEERWATHLAFARVPVPAEEA